MGTCIEELILSEVREVKRLILEPRKEPEFSEMVQYLERRLKEATEMAERVAGISDSISTLYQARFIAKKFLKDN